MRVNTLTGRPPGLEAPASAALRAEIVGRSRADRQSHIDVQIAQAGARRNGDPVPDQRIDRVAITDLKSACRRTRKASKSQVARIRASVLRFGQVNPIIVDQDLNIINGHVVVAACIELDIRVVNVIRVDHLGREELRLLGVTLNRLAETGEWDFEALAVELRELTVLGEPLTITGFDEPILDALLIEDAPAPSAKIDRLPGLETSAVARPGDVFQLGEHRLACGDARDLELIGALLDGEPIRLAWIDAPYNVAIAGHVTSQAHREFAMASGEMSVLEFTEFLTAAFRPLVQCMAPGGVLLSWMDWRHMSEMTAAVHTVDLEQINLIVWTKTNAGMGSLWRSQHELVGAYKKPGGAVTNNVELGKSGRWRSNVWRYPGASSLGSDARGELAGHPTPKPVALLMDGIRDVTNRGDIVVDTFSGSGSTLIACEKTERRFRGIEIDPLYVDLAIRRWKRDTGLKATLTGSGTPFDEIGATAGLDTGDAEPNAKDNERAEPAEGLV